jgi:hypothetical protein
MALTTEIDYRMLPKYLLTKRAILNPRNNDYRSFDYAIMFALNPNDWRICALNPQNKFKFTNFGLDKLKYNVLLVEIPAYEELLNIRKNVFTFDDVAGFKRHSLYISKMYKPEEVKLCIGKIVML